MNQKRLALLVNVPVLLGLALAACGKPPPETPSARAPGSSASPDSKRAPSLPASSSKQPASEGDIRKAAPAPGPEVVFIPPKIEEARLPNGVRILLVERHELPIVAFQIVIDRGADQAPPGLATFAAAMLLQGTKTRSAIALSDELLKLGASYEAWADYDSVNLGARSLAQKFDEVLTVMGDVVLRPAFDESEIKREKSRRLTAILQQNDRPATLLSNTVAGALYPEGHPYSVPLIGTEPEVAKVKAADLSSFHAAQFKPDRVTVAIAGDIQRGRAVEAIQRVFGAWQGKAQQVKEAAEPPPPASGTARVILVDRPAATQSHVSVALPGVPRLSKDFDAILVMNTLLGGTFSSRLNMNLREKHAYTYGARSGFDMRHGPGPFSAGGAIMRESTGAAVKEILSEISRIRAEAVSGEEIEDARSTLILQLPARFETSAETASSLAALAAYALPLDEYATRAARIKKVTREDIRRVAEKYLVPERLRILVVGDAKVVEPQLAKLDLGAVSVRGASENKK